MKRKYEMIEKGWEYKTEGYTLKKTYDRKAITHTGFSTLDRHALVQSWNVYPDNEAVIYKFHTLKEAKDFINNKDMDK